MPWSYIHNDEENETDYETMQAALDAAQKWLVDHVEDTHEDLRNGDIVDDEIQLIEFVYDEHEDRKIIQTIPSTVEYEHYHGDYAEHFRERDYI